MRRQFHESKNKRAYFKVNNDTWDIYFKSRTLYNYANTVNLHVNIWDIYQDLTKLLIPQDFAIHDISSFRYSNYK